jgi:DNA-binding transcriptional MerR regulator
MITTKYMSTSELAHCVGVHPNTVRLYEGWGLMPPVERSPSGYRLFTQRHLDCLRLARLIYAAEYPGRYLRASGNQIIQKAVADDWIGAMEKAHEHLNSVLAELDHANTAAALLEHWAQTMEVNDDEGPLAIGEVSGLLGVSLDVIRNWERNGLICVPRDPENGYRRFGKKEIERLRIIRLLSRAGYSHMAMLRMFLELDRGNRSELRKLLDAPREDEEIFTAADHWLTTLNGQVRMAYQVIQLIEGQISKRSIEPCEGVQSPRASKR